jgi:hypothetical protein
MKAVAFAIAMLLAAAPAFGEDAKEAPAAKPAADEQGKAEITVKGAIGDEATKAKLRANVLLARCQIKPVMTDEEINLCVTAYKQSR